MRDKMEDPKINVIIPFKNHREQLFRAIESIYNQTYQNFHIFIAPNGERLSYTFVMDKVTVLPFYDKKADAMNSALSVIPDGEWVAFQDADDASLNYRFAVCKHYIDKGSDFIYGDKITVDRKGHFKYDNARYFSNIYLKHGSLGVWSSIMVKSDIAKQIRFRDDVLYGDDYIWTIDLYLSDLVQHPAHVAMPFYYYHNYTSNYRLRPGKLPYVTALRNRWKLKKMRGETQKIVDELL